MQHICYSRAIVLMQGDQRDAVDERTIALIAERVIEALREDLETIAVQLSVPAKPSQQLTVGQVARRLGVARSTVYAHWREWGGYKLGSGRKAPIRFDSNALPAKPVTQPPLALSTATTPKRERRRRHSRDLLQDAPRVLPPLPEVA